MSQTAEGKEELLKKIKEANPEINGEADKSFGAIQLNAEQLERRKTFLQNAEALVGKALSSIGNTIKSIRFYPLLLQLQLLSPFSTLCQHWHQELAH